MNVLGFHLHILAGSLTSELCPSDCHSQQGISQHHHIWLNYFCLFFLSFSFFETGFFCVTLAVLEFPLYIRIALKSLRSAFYASPMLGLETCVTIPG